MKSEKWIFRLNNIRRGMTEWTFCVKIKNNTIACILRTVLHCIYSLLTVCASVWEKNIISRCVVEKLKFQKKKKKGGFVGDGKNVEKHWYGKR